MSISVRRVIALGASLVCRVREHEVTGEGRLDRDLRRLVVADLTEQHDIRVGTQDASAARSRRSGPPSG